MTGSRGLPLFRRWMAALLMLLAPALLAAQAIEPPSARGKDMPVYADIHPGPIVWKEEYWDIKPENYEAFLEVYRRDVYPVARAAHGYRGMILMSFAPKNGDRVPTGHPPRAAQIPIIHGHAGLYTNGVLTRRSLDIGKLIAGTHSVVIAHSFATWADAERYDREFAARYAAAHGGGDGWELLAKSLFPLARNYWETYFRLVSTGYPSVATKPGTDADGLDLTPRKGGFMVKEYWDIDPAKLDRFVDAYDRLSYRTVRESGGNRGITFLTSVPAPGGASAMGRYAREHFPLGGPPALYVAHPGVQMDGVRTDQSLNLSAPFRQTFNVIVYHHQTTNADSLGFDLLDRIWRAAHPGAPGWVAVLEKDFFPLAKNHWDMTYFVEDDSFVPDAAGLMPADTKRGTK